MARRQMVVGNWKMNGNRASSQRLLADILAGLPDDTKAEVGVCPPDIYIPDLSVALVGRPILLGAQTVSDQDAGAFTGEISAPMLVEFGVSIAIVGHSERRTLYHESDALAAGRYSKAIAHGIRPVLCVGETLQEREQGRTFAVISAQLAAVFELCGVASMAKAIIAYEPVWAIGTGVTATPEQAQEVHAFIRGKVAEDEPQVAESLQILYGGSVKPDNARDLFDLPDVDGGLVGGASLNAESFLAICRAA